MRKNYTQLFTLVFMMLIALNATAQKALFQDIAERNLNRNSVKRVIKPFKYRTVTLDSVELLKTLRAAPSEKNVISGINKPQIMLVPLPNGKSARFKIWECPVMAPELAAQFPNIKTYAGQGIDDPLATIKLDWTEMGFHAMILSPVSTSIFIDGYERNDKKNYISYFKSDFVKKEAFSEEGESKLINDRKAIILNNAVAKPAQVLASQCIGTQLRTYRLAVACTGEYAVAATGLASPTVAQTLSCIVTTVNRVDGVYEKDLDIRIVLVPTETNVVFTNASTDPFSGNNNANTLITESQTVIDANIGNANYDMGHTFSTGGGGLSDLGVICQTGSKASSITGSPSPVGDPYDIDYVAHEMGHSIGADHTFNSKLGSCSGNGSNTTNAEPGSGTTIMAYAGICSTDDLQPHSDPNFHAVSLDEITAYMINGTGNTCAVVTSTGNIAPVVNAGANYTIPISTPFVMTGSATDANGDVLSYSWEETDIGGAYNAWNAPSGNDPIFRSFPPVATPVRYFPKLSDVINNTTTIGEIMPSYARTLHFRLTARDNKAGGGGVCFDTTTVAVSAAAGPLAVTYPTATGITWNGGESRAITWNVANTNLSPVSCANMTIQLSTDGGNTYPYTLLASTPNNGTANITVPNIVTTTARIRVMAVGNIFYDISNNNFAIKVSTPTFTFSTPDTVRICGADSGTTKLYSDSLAGYNKTISLTSSGNPAGTTVSLSKTTLNTHDSVIVTLHGTSTLAAGTYNVTITGVSDTITKTRIIPFVVGTSAGTSTLTSPANDTTGQGLTPTFKWTAVAGAISYVLEISVSNTFATITQSIPGITATSYTLTTALAENTIYYWRVKAVNYCGAGTPTASFLFRTGIGGCTTFTSTNVPKTISATGSPTVNSTLVIPAASGVTITDINVIGLVGTHTWISDLTVSLIAPTGKADTLFDQICNDGNQYQNFNISLDDQASTTTFPCPPTGSLTVVPAFPLSVFNGLSSAGTWTLRIKDNYTGDGGSLTGWGLQICSLTPTPLNLEYIFNGDGNWDNPANWVNSSVPPATLLAGSTITIDPVITGECLLNIPYTVTPGSILRVMPNKKFRVPDNLTIQ
jgi:subtilisin-like proprotein convertase family protein